jgi:hypothetical protein
MGIRAVRTLLKLRIAYICPLHTLRFLVLFPHSMSEGQMTIFAQEQVLAHLIPSTILKSETSHTELSICLRKPSALLLDRRVTAASVKDPGPDRF